MTKTKMALFAAVMIVAGCGGSDGGDGGNTPDATADVTSGDANRDDAPIADAATDRAADSAADASSQDASTDAITDGASDADAAIACNTPADCPALPCPLGLTGCVGGFCQYANVPVCHVRDFYGTFTSGFVDTTVGTTTVRGNIGKLPDVPPVCVGTTCIAGGIAP